jgi:hypothetical protein
VVAEEGIATVVVVLRRAEDTFKAIQEAVMDRATDRGMSTLAEVLEEAPSSSSIQGEEGGRILAACRLRLRVSTSSLSCTARPSRPFPLYLPAHREETQPSRAQR